MSREVRKVPKDWIHPHDKPLHENNGRFKQEDKDWNEGYTKWQKGLCESYDKDNPWEPIDEEYKNKTYSDYAGSRPSPDDYMPDWAPEECTHLMMYETTSEGTSMSPAFETPEELAQWLVDNNASSFASMTATYEQWLNICKGGYAVSAVYTPETGLISGVEASENLT